MNIGIFQGSVLDVNIDIFQGSILDVPDVDVIVNPANSHLAHGGGVAKIIARAAAPLAGYTSLDSAYMAGGKGSPDIRLYDQDVAWAVEQAQHPLIATGGAGWTSAGRLPYKGIIHAVGPVWGGGGYYERALLKSAHQNACARAYEHGCRHIAIPAISCGIFGFPVEKAAPVAVRSVADFWTRGQPIGLGLKVTFALFEQAHVDAYTKALSVIR